MNNYLTDAYRAASLGGRTPDQRAIVDELRSMLGDEKIMDIYNGNIDDGYSESDYHFYWIAAKLIEMDKNGESKDGLKYPNHGWINGEFWSPCNLISSEINSIEGIHAGSMTIYKHGTCYNTKAWMSVIFDTIEAFNRFLWAGCYRYFDLSKSELWRLVPDFGDPDLREKKLKFELHYLDIDADAEKMEEDFKIMANGIKEYATCQQFPDAEGYEVWCIDELKEYYQRMDDEKKNEESDKETE